jgi:anti-anti-sigma factor
MQMPGAGFPAEEVAGVLVVTTPAEIDMTNADGLRTALLDAVGDGHRRVVIDMTGTRFCDSAGVHVLASAHRRALAEDHQLMLAVSDDAVLRVFSIMGIDQVIPSFATLAEALAHASANGSEPAGA